MGRRSMVWIFSLIPLISRVFMCPTVPPPPGQTPSLRLSPVDDDGELALLLQL
jgi:hypothetical protein